jgi:beta-lactamase class D
MKSRVLVMGVLAWVGSLGALCGGNAAVERPEWRRFFAQMEATGTVVIVDQRPGGRSGFVDAERANRQFCPASTFKIPHALFALEAGVVRDEFQVFEWDGVEHSIEPWNRDQNLRSSMRNSVVWVYEEFARKIGLEREAAYLKKASYGNQQVSGKAPFWLEGDLAISAVEQVAFMQKLYRNELPFKVEHQRLVKDVMIVEAGRDWILRAKTGWSGTLGWWVGWVERPGGPVFFALNIDTPDRMGDLPKREGIVRAILRSIEALP